MVAVPFLATSNGWTDGYRWKRYRSVQPANPDPGAVVLAELARAGVALLGGPDRQRLQVCHAPGCGLFFVKQHPRREWCSTACGNRARAARHYSRHYSRHRSHPSPAQR